MVMMLSGAFETIVHIELIIIEKSFFYQQNRTKSSNCNEWFCEF